MRSWTLPDGGELIEIRDRDFFSYEHRRGDEVLFTYNSSAASDAELYYVWSHRVDGDRFENVMYVVVGPPADRMEVTPGAVIFEGLVPNGDFEEPVIYHGKVVHNPRRS